MAPNYVLADVLRPPQVRRHNRALVLQLLRRHRLLSRAELARQSGLTDGAVSRITADLLKLRLIVEEGSQPHTGGRPACNLRLEDEYWRSIGVDLHGPQIRLATGGLSGRIIEAYSIRSNASPAEVLDKVVRQINRWQDESQGRKIEGVGVSAPGVVDAASGVVELGRSRVWNNVMLKTQLEKRIPFPVHVENDVRAAAMAESTFGSLETMSASNVFHVYVDEGVGIGLVLDRKLHFGSRMAAGEFGQMIISDTPGPIPHEVPGSLEQLSSNPAICERYRRLTGYPVGSDVDGTAAQVRKICRLATEGDAAAHQALVESVRYLGIGIANVIWGLAPDVVIIDGAITEAWEIVRDTIQQQFPQGPEYLNFRHISLCPSALGGEASLMGAMALPFFSFFSTGDPAPRDTPETKSKSSATSRREPPPAVSAADPVPGLQQPRSSPGD